MFGIRRLFGCHMIGAILSAITIGQLLSGSVGGAYAGKRTKASSDSVAHVPAFRSTEQNVSVSPGDRAVLKCRVDHLGTKIVSWRKLNEEHPLTIGRDRFVSDERVSIDNKPRGNDWNLVIDNVRLSDDGVYQCQISTKEDSGNSHNVTLHVKTVGGEIPDTEKDTLFVAGASTGTGVHVSGQEYVDRGRPIQILCNATGFPDPPYNIDWYKDGEKVNSDVKTGIIITKKIEARILISMLVIKSSQMIDSGVYVCRSSNRDAGMITVQVLNVPSNVEKRGTYAEKITSNGNFVSDFQTLSGSARSSFVLILCLSVALHLFARLSIIERIL